MTRVRTADRGRRRGFGALAGSALAIIAGAQAGEPPAPTVTAFEDARFAPLDPARPDGPQIAVLWGDPARGPSTMLMKFGRLQGRLHVHTADYHLVLLEGTMRHWQRGEDEADAKPLGPGSYWFQPGGQAHADSCLSETCVMFIQWAGARDARLAE